MVTHLNRAFLFVVVSFFILTTFFCYINLHDEVLSLSNTEPKFNHLLCILVPFRNCEYELNLMVPELHVFLTNQSVSHLFLILNQTDSLRFNRASLINVGWYEADRLNCDYLVMHDVDIVPLNTALNYRFPGQNVIRHISAGEYHPIKRYNYEKFIGGVLMLTMADYKRVDGMSNKYWGWGLEDDEFYLRLKEANLSAHIERPVNLTTDHTNTFRHIHGPERKRDYIMIGNQKAMSRKRDRISGLHSIKYNVSGREVRRFDLNAEALIINIELQCDRNWTSYCELPTENGR